MVNPLYTGAPKRGTLATIEVPDIQLHLIRVMRRSRNFRKRGGGGGPGQSDKSSSDNVFLVLSLFYRSQMVNFKEIYHFSRFQSGSNIFQGVQLFPGGRIAYSLKKPI